jgi:hypothetical protein
LSKRPKNRFLVARFRILDARFGIQDVINAPPRRQKHVVSSVEMRERIRAFRPEVMLPIVPFDTILKNRKI